MAYSNDNSFDNEPITNDTDDTQGQFNTFFPPILAVIKLKTLKIVDSELETGAVWLQLQSFQFVVSFVTFLFAICVLIAAWMNSRRRLLLLPWLIFQPLFTILCSMFFYCRYCINLLNLNHFPHTLTSK
jgi:hypothetical protein